MNLKVKIIIKIVFVKKQRILKKIKNKYYKMIECEYYKNYKGPNLILAQIWVKKDEKQDITEYIKDFYGSKNNWNGKLYKYNDIFPGKDYKYKFFIKFKDDKGREHWFNGMVGGSDQYFNPPLATPINQNL